MLQWTLGCLCSFEKVFWVSSDIFPEVELLSHKAVSFLIFSDISILLSTMAAPVCIPTNSAWEFLFSTSSPTLVVCWFIDDSHADRCEMISHCGFNLHFSDDYWCWSSFHMSINHLYVLFGEVSIQTHCLPFNWTVCYLVLSYISSL